MKKTNCRSFVSLAESSIFQSFIANKILIYHHHWPPLPINKENIINPLSFAPILSVSGNGAKMKPRKKIYQTNQMLKATSSR